ncbi:MAG: nitroreductase family protein [Candidatus Firestonebacteria bacterium]
MKNFIELVNKRYSVRDFLDKPVEREKIKLCLESARLAPSACNSQPWKFIVIDEVNLKNKLCDKIFSGPYKINIFAKKAPVIVVVISEKSTFLAKVGGLLRDTRYYLIDIGIAVEHFILQATELNLGTCWIGWFNEKQAKKILNIPNNKKIDIVIPVGYPAQPMRKKIRKSLEEIFTFNEYED